MSSSKYLYVVLILMFAAAAALASPAHHVPLSFAGDDGAPSGNAGPAHTARPAQAQAKKIPATATVNVDCRAQDSINDALNTAAVALTVVIHGVCTENVLIARDNVALSGSSPASDGVRGIASTVVLQAAITVTGSNVVIQNLSVAGGAFYGINAWRSGRVTVTGCDVSGNKRGGITSSSGLLVVSNTTVHDQERLALSAWMAGDIFCDACTVSGTPLGALAASGSRMILSNSTIHATQYALLAQEHGFVSADTVSFDGSIDLEDHSAMALAAAVQSSDPEGFYDTLDSAMTLDRGSVLLGPISLAQFSTLTVQGGSTISGNLSCTSGGNAFCENPSGVSGTASGCSACVKP